MIYCQQLRGRRCRISSGYFYENNAQGMRASVGRSLTFPMHLHMQAELVCITEGRTAITIEAKRLTLEAGDAALVWPGCVHGYESIGESAHAFVIADLSLLPDFREVLTNAHCPEPYLRCRDVHPDIPASLFKLTEERNLTEPLRRAYLNVAFGRVLDALKLEPRRALGGRDALHNLLTYVGAHIAEPMSLKSLSHALYLNKYTISKLFNERVGCGMNDYVNALRISMAETLLRDTQDGIPQIAQQCGFGSERTFYRTFQAQRGVSPSAYRKCLRAALQK